MVGDNNGSGDNKLNENSPIVNSAASVDDVSGASSPAPVEPAAEPVVASSPAAETPAVSPSPTAPEEKKKKNRVFLLVGGLVGLIVLFYLASSVVPQMLVYLSRATNAPGNYSLSNSYLFGSPLVALANGEDKIRVTAFLLDAKGKGVPNRQVEVRVSAKDGGGTAQVAATQPQTDEFGRSVFEVVSASPGQFSVSAMIDGLEFPQAVTLTFR